MIITIFTFVTLFVIAAILFATLGTAALAIIFTFGDVIVFGLVIFWIIRAIVRKCRKSK